MIEVFIEFFLIYFWNSFKYFLKEKIVKKLKEWVYVDSSFEEI